MPVNHPPTKNPIVHFYYEFEDVLWHSFFGFFTTFFLLYLVFRLASATGNLAFIIISIALLYGHIVIGMALMFKKSLSTLFNSRSILRLLVGYILSAMLLIGFLAPLYFVAEATSTGYLKYGICSDTMTKEQMAKDTENNAVSHERLYFTAVTFFSLGYGDVCPMGLSKYIALLNVAVGMFFVTAIMAIAIARFQRRTADEENEEKQKPKGK